MTIRLLLIDDNKSDRALVLRELQREFADLEVQEIISSGDFNQAIAAGNFDAVVTDFQLRWTTGLDILQTVKSRYPHCPVIMFTNTGTEEIAVEAMKLGLDDYIIKESNRYVRVPISVRVAIDRTAAQHQAALLEIRFRTLLEQLTIGVFRVNEGGELMECNPAFLTLLGANSIDQARTLLPPALFVSALQNFGESSTRPEKQEISLQRGDGRQISVLLITIVTQLDGTTIIDGLLEAGSDRLLAASQ